MHPLLGVDLPDGVGLLPALPLHRRALGAPRLQAGGAKPALDRPHLGQELVGKLGQQFQTDQAGAPGGVLPLQGQGRLVDDRGGPGCLGAAVVVMGVQARLALLPKAAPPLADGAVLRLQALGDGGEGLALLVTLDDLLALGERERTRHDTTSRKGSRQAPKNERCNLLSES